MQKKGIEIRGGLVGGDNVGYLMPVVLQSSQFQLAFSRHHLVAFRPTVSPCPGLASLFWKDRAVCCLGFALITMSVATIQLCSWRTKSDRDSI